MFDDLLTLVIQHYVIVGILAVAAGVLFNLAFTAGPEIMQALQKHKIY